MCQAQGVSLESNWTVAMLMAGLGDRTGLQGPRCGRSQNWLKQPERKQIGIQLCMNNRWAFLKGGEAGERRAPVMDRVPEVLGSAELREEASWMVTNSAHPPHDYKRAAAAPPPSPWPTMAKTGPRFWSSVFRSSHFTPESQGYHPPYFPSRVLKI